MNYLVLKKLSISLLIITFFTVSSHLLLNLNSNVSYYYSKSSIDLTSNKLKIADYWILTPIIIDDSDPNLSWYKAALDNDWCTGNGSLDWPFSIENITISGGGITNSLAIRNSNASFIIRNSTFYNSGNLLGSNAGIRLQNVENAVIINNTVYNSYYGILLDGSNYNNFTENKINYNHNGIYLDTSFNNSITYNLLINNDEAISEVNCAGNTIDNNQIIELLSNNNGDGVNFPGELIGIFIIILVILMILTGMVLLRKKIFKKKYSLELKPNKRKEINQYLQDTENSTLLKIKRAILDLGTKYNRINLKDIIENTRIGDEKLLSYVILDMIDKKEIYAKYFESTKAIVFDKEMINNRIDDLMEKFKEWEESRTDKKTE